jgi:hypothetical protein
VVVHINSHARRPAEPGPDRQARCRRAGRRGRGARGRRSAATCHDKQGDRQDGFAHEYCLHWSMLP